MPVSCKKVDDKYHLVHADGTVAEHDTLESCEAQMRAINMNIAASIPPQIIYFCPTLEKFAASNESLCYEKELIYQGSFEQGDLHFSVTPVILRHWDATIKEMLANGIKIPMPLEHTFDPEKTRAFIENSEIKLNKKGKLALYGKVRFRDEEAAKLALSSDISIFVTGEIKDGNGNLYLRPIQHVAFTNYPVIPGLENFQAIAASLVGELPMSGLSKLAQQLNLPIKSEEEMIFSILNLIKPKSELPPQLLASLEATFKDSRLTKLHALVDKGHITKATSDALEKNWCSKEALALSADAVPQTNDAFESLVKALEHNQALSFGERTHGQAVSLSNPMIPSVNELVQNAEARAKAAQN